MLTLLYTLLVTHITIVCVTVYLHRGKAHKALIFHPALEHFMRAWLWLTTGMVTKQWVAIHRKHHSLTDKEGDPHSPHVFGIWHVLFKGALLYNDASKNKTLVDNFGKGSPEDWVERKIYTPHSRIGILIMLAIDVLLFGWWGFLVWGIQMIWIPFWAAGVINGIGHYWGYRNGETKDKSRNIFPLGLLIGGECLHNNHHLEPANPKLSRQWFEFDIGWMYIQIFKKLKLLEIRTNAA